MAGNLTGAGPQHRRGDDRRRQRRPVAEDHRRRPRRDPRAQGHRSTRWSTSSARSRPRSRASRARSAPRASSAARPTVKDVAGTWKDLTDSVNSMAGNLTAAGPQHRRRHQGRRRRRPVAQDHASTSAARSSSSRTPSTRMVDQLRSFAAEVTRVAARGRHRGQARRPGRRQGVAGTWKDLTDNVNSMASNLTSQVRNIADVTKAVAAGDLSQQDHASTSAARSSSSKDTDQHAWSTSSRSFAAEVTRVAREVGTEGKLGGQARRHGRGRHLEGPHRQRQLDGRVTSPARCAASRAVVTAVANGDLRSKLTRRSQGRDRRAGRHDQHR